VASMAINMRPRISFKCVRKKKTLSPCSFPTTGTRSTGLQRRRRQHRMR
jgi:hypothetical protein